MPAAPLPRWTTPLLAALFAAITLWLTTADNRFPGSYHPDEPSKARQVLAGEFNFHHPMLLLTTTRAVAALTGTPGEPQAITVAGRWASALFTGAAVFCLVLIAGILAGPFAAAVAGALLALNHQLFELAHYFKEDPALLVGLSAFFLALLAFDRAPTAARALTLGAALALAASGKYIGATAAPLALLALWHHRRAAPPLRAVPLFLLGVGAVFALVNLPVFLDPAAFAGGLAREVDFAVAGHKGITRDVPHGVYWKVFLDSTMPLLVADVSATRVVVVGLLLVVFYADLIVRRREISLGEWCLALFPIAFAILLSFSPKTHHRYFLPATGLLLALAAVGAARLPAFVAAFRPAWRSLARRTALVLVTIALAAQVPTFARYYDGFQRDGRSALAAWLAANVPPGTVIVQDKRVDLDALGLPYDFRGKLFAADEGTLDELHAAGVRYVAVAEGDYGRFFRDDHRATGEGAADYARRRAFYEQLFAEGELVLDVEPGQLQYLQPRLRLYRIREDASPRDNDHEEE